MRTFCYRTRRFGKQAHFENDVLFGSTYVVQDYVAFGVMVFMNMLYLGLCRIRYSVVCDYDVRGYVVWDYVVQFTVSVWYNHRIIDYRIEKSIKGRRIGHNLP